MLTTHFEKLKMSEDKSFNSFYGKLNEVVIGKFNLGEKTENSKIVRKIHYYQNKWLLVKESQYLLPTYS